jgi:polyhydroxyalkanoate synthesis regulator phasin
MEAEERKGSDSGVVGRLAGRGEEAMSRLMDELGRNRTVTDALTRALAAKGMLDSASRTALTQVGLAPADDVRELTQRVMELEKRLAKLEGRSTPQATRQKKPAAKTSARAKGTSASKSTRPPAPRTGSSGQA